MEDAATVKERWVKWEDGTDGLAGPKMFWLPAFESLDPVMTVSLWIGEEDKPACKALVGAVLVSDGVTLATGGAESRCRGRGGKVNKVDAGPAGVD